MHRLLAAALAIAQLIASPTWAESGAQHPSASPGAPIDRADQARLGAIVDSTVLDAMRRDVIAGVNVAIVSPTGPALIRSFGIMAPGRPVTPNTLFPIQSISKTMVWIALMQLVEQGRIRLDDPVNRYLPPELQIPDQGFRQPIRIWHLMSHTPGFEDAAYGVLFVDRPERLLPLDRWLERFRVRRVREPGQLVVYSNYGAALAGSIVAHVTGMSWQDYAEQRIIRPLGMDATFRQPYSADLARQLGLPAPMDPQMAARMTDGFHVIGGRLTPARHEYTSDFPAGAAVATPKAMAAYMQALLDPGRMQQAGVLRAATVLAMREPLFHGPEGFGEMRHGFGAQSLPGGLEGFGHNGGSTYQSANMTLIPQIGLGVFVSSNTANGYGLSQRLREAIVTKLFGAGLPAAAYGPTSGAEAKAHSGEYRDLQRPYFRTEHGLYDLMIDDVSVSPRPNGDLVIGSLLGSSRRYVPLGGGVYRDAAGSERIAFRPLGDSEGIYEPYRDLTFSRIGLFETPEWGFLVMFGALAAAIAVVAVAFAGALRKPTMTPFTRFAAWSLTAAAIAWLIGFGLFGAVLVKGLTADDISEIMWWYPPAALIWACWAFAVAAALSLVALPGLAAVGRARGWSPSRRAVQVIATLAFVLCAFELWRLSFLGFSGW